ncbi:MAG: NAD(P)H-dependent oxidoreductase subunit E, partial [Bryocella sp.]
VTADGMFSLEEVECIGACCWAPAAQVNYDFHENLTPEKMDAVLADYAAGKGKNEPPSPSSGSATGGSAKESE